MPANVKRSENLEKHLTKEELQARQAAEAEILDDLDGEMLAVYCSALSRRDSLNTLCRALVAEMEGAGTTSERLEVTNKLDGLMSKLQAHEKTLLSFADKLGMTPEARVRLARKRAERVEQAPDDDLYGD